jgi:UDP-N-acetylglucosamine 4,6-dehydratase
MNKIQAIRNFKCPEPNLDNASILITGVTGSFGRGYLNTVLERYRPKKTIVFSKDELKQVIQ